MRRIQEVLHGSSQKGSAKILEGARGTVEEFEQDDLFGQPADLWRKRKRLPTDGTGQLIVKCLGKQRTDDFGGNLMERRIRIHAQEK